MSQKRIAGGRSISLLQLAQSPSGIHYRKCLISRRGRVADSIARGHHLSGNTNSCRSAVTRKYITRTATTP
jgi:hypothetical protein